MGEELRRREGVLGGIIGLLGWFKQVVDVRSCDSTRQIESPGRRTPIGLFRE